MMTQHTRWTRQLMVGASLLLAAVASLHVVAQDKTVVDFYYPSAVDGPINQTIERYAT